jgi:2-haloacid dehalogenase
VPTAESPGRKPVELSAVKERWATFDCYGTLIDWNRGIRDELERLFGEDDERLACYHELEPAVQAADPGLTYAEVTARVLEQLGAPPAERDALARSLPSWPVFSEVPGALEELRVRGWRICILSNSDRDLIESSILAIGVPFDDSIVASEIGSYKPAPGHWQEFERRRGRLPDAHVAASLFHDVAPANKLGFPSVWINRLGEEAGAMAPAHELPDLSRLPGVLDELVAA